MANTTVKSEQIEDGSITADKIADGAIVATELADNAVTTAKINADAVTGAKIADDAINSEHYTDGSIDTAHIADDQVTQAKMANDSVGADELASNAVVTASIVDANVTTAKIADGNISTAKIADNAVTSAKIDTNIAIAGDLTVQGGQINTGNTSGDHSEFGTDGSGHTFIDASTSGGDIFLQAGGSTKVTMKSDGKVGIGTTSPVNDLHIAGAASTAVYLKLTNATTGNTAGDGSAIGIDADGDLIIHNAEAKEQKFYTSDTQRMTIGSGGEVGIGTNSPARLLHLYANSSGDTAIMRIQDNGSHVAGIELYSGHGNWGIYNSDTVADTFEIRDESANELRMKILNDGEIVQGTASLADTYDPLVNGITGDALVVGRHANSGSLGLWRTNTMEFKYYHNGSGYIMTFGSNGVISGDFNDTSDVNLKENISTIADGTTVIKALRPVKFDWKASGKGNNQHGFIAQEVETVLPDAVEGNDYVENKTGLPEDEPEQNGKTMNSNAVLAHAVKAIQELEARIEALES